MRVVTLLDVFNFALSAIRSQRGQSNILAAAASAKLKPLDETTKLHR
jgi:hypothetical protein